MYIIFIYRHYPASFHIYHHICMMYSMLLHRHFVRRRQYIYGRVTLEVLDVIYRQLLGHPCPGMRTTHAIISSTSSQTSKSSTDLKNTNILYRFAISVQFSRDSLPCSKLYNEGCTRRLWKRGKGSVKEGQNLVGVSYHHILGHRLKASRIPSTQSQHAT
jgi:hypothetical protein